MARAKPYTTDGKITGYEVRCPGCKSTHVFNTKPDNPNGLGGFQPTWKFVNNNLEKPTFRASMLMKCGHYASSSSAKTPEDCWLCKEVAAGDRTFTPCCICHSFVTDGKIQFLGDCTHALCGQTVDLPDWDAVPDTKPSGA